MKLPRMSIFFDSKALIFLFIILFTFFTLSSCSDSKKSETYLEDVEDIYDGSNIVSTEINNLPGEEPVACEWDWTIRMLHYHPKSITPRRMYFGTCNNKTQTPLFFTSLTIGKNADHPTEDPTSGGIIVSQYNPQTGKLDVTGKRHFPECQEMHGIAVSKDCTVIAALCRISSGTTGYDKDVLATHHDADWMTNKNLCGDKMNDEMWLYEWTDGNIQSTPEKYIVHKSIGSWEYGNNYLKLGENDNTYGIALKTTVGKDDNCHEADAFLIMDRSTYSMTNRGWSWACGTGHTLFNRPAYNKITKKYAMLCTTDYNIDEIPQLGANFFRIEDQKSQQFKKVNYKGLKIKGGVSTIHGRPDGGFIGVVVGVDGKISSGEPPLSPPTSIGLVKFDQDGNMEGDIKWIIKKKNTYLSYAQLVYIENNEYLLGFGVMKKLDDPDDNRDVSFRIPSEYWLVKIDGDGNLLNTPEQLDAVGWGEQDELIYIGGGKVAWSYIKDPTLKNNTDYPDCNADSLLQTVYIIP